MTDVILALILTHLLVDWFLQSDWQATNKMKWVRIGARRCHSCWPNDEHRCHRNRKGIPLPHIAGIYHAFLHFVWTLYALWMLHNADVTQGGRNDALLVAGVIALAHWVIDMRFPLNWWRKFMAQTTDPSNPASLHVAIWQDQIAHVAVIAVTVWLLA